MVGLQLTAFRIGRIRLNRNGPRCYNVLMFLTRLSKACREACYLDPDRLILVGVSGGADSLALLHGLFQLDYPLAVAHLDHGLRPDSASDAVFVRSLAESYGLPFVHQRIDVRQSAAAEGQSLEEAARTVRYHFLFDQARHLAAQAVAVAHHADDQVETVLMHFLRGAGLPGLSGMAYRRRMPLWDEEVPLVRPLLGHWREEIEAFVAEAGLSPRMDPSNRDETFFRNRLRHSLIPRLKSYNPQVRRVLWRMADVLRTEEDFLSALTGQAWEACRLRESGGWIQFCLPAFLSQPAALQRRILRQAVATLRPDVRDVGLEALERALTFIRARDQGGPVDFLARLDLTVIADVLIIKTWDAPLPDWDAPRLPSADFNAPLAPGKELNLDNAWRISVAEMQAPPMDQPWLDAGPWTVWLDSAPLKWPLTVRGRRPGDRWQPLGMGGHTQKLKDYFINEKIPAHLRDRWPLVCSEGKILWVVGLRRSELAKIVPETRNVLRCTARRMGDG